MWRHALSTCTFFVAILLAPRGLAAAPAPAPDSAHAPLAPMAGVGHPVDWWFTFKFNTKTFAGCGDGAARACPFGGTPKTYSFGQQYVSASSAAPELKKGGGCVGSTEDDPVGATYARIYEGDSYFVVWNDQFYDDPVIKGCKTECGGPWGHSKGILAWDDSGAGLVMQVSTPSWPGAGARAFPRASDGNTLGCVRDDNVLVSQHFFAVRLSKDDVLSVLDALQNASVVTDPGNRQIIHTGGPADIQAAVARLGTRSQATTATTVRLSTGVGLISKPSKLHVPPWQMVSATLGGVSLRTATWWAAPFIYSTTATTALACWDASLGKPGAVDIATTGQWQQVSMGLRGGKGPDFNHAKIGVTTSGTARLSIFGDMNQQGTRSGPACDSSQNGRGGLFYVVENATLADGVAALLHGASAPTMPPPK